jgi:hypothetical protein
MLPDIASTYAVLVGSSDYLPNSGLQNLPAVRNNLADLRRTLVDQKILGLAGDHVVSVTNPRNAAMVTKTIREVGKRPGISTLVVYYAGHGMPDDQAQLHLALSESDIEEMPASWLPFDWVRRSIRECAAATRVLIVDCCYAGLAGPGKMGGADGIGAQANIVGTWTLYSSGETFPSWAPPGERNTTFTGQLIDILRTGVRNGPPELDGDTLTGELQRRLAAQGAPLPEQYNSEMGYRIALARNLTPATGVIRASQETTAQEARRAALQVSVRVQWVDEKVRQVDKLRDDEQYWVIYVLNSSHCPLQDMLVTVASPDRKVRVNFRAVEPGKREVYILRPPDMDFPLDGPVPEATATFEVLGSRWQLRDGRLSTGSRSHQASSPFTSEAELREALGRELA